MDSDEHIHVISPSGEQFDLRHCVFCLIGEDVVFERVVIRCPEPGFVCRDAVVKARLDFVIPKTIRPVSLVAYWYGRPVVQGYFHLDILIGPEDHFLVDLVLESGEFKVIYESNYDESD